MTETLEPEVGNDQARLSLSTAAARNLATTTKSVPQMRNITPRWLLRVLPWVEASGGTYRVNRRLSYTVGDGRIEFIATGADVRVIPAELGELAPLRDFDDLDVLGSIADRCQQREYEAGQVIVEPGRPTDEVLLIVHGKVNCVGTTKYGSDSHLGLLADGDQLGARALVTEGTWDFSVRAVTAVTILALPVAAFREVVNQSEALRAHLDAFRASGGKPANKHGEAEITLASGHDGEPDLPGTYVDYDESPREYPLSVAQTVLRVHSRVADLYNGPMDQVEQQLRLTIEALRERQEYELVNNREFGLLHNADYSQRFQTRSGPPTPDDMDNLLARRRKTKFFLAHPRVIAAIGHECNRRGICPAPVEVDGRPVQAWRGVPILPCDKIPITETNTSSIMAMRVGQEDEGVIGLHQTGLPDEYQPGLSVRFMGINEKAVLEYVVSTYYSAAVLVPDALGILENVEIGSTGA